MSIDQDIRAQQEANSAYLKMRSKYRAKLADMELIIASDAFADPATKLLHGPRLKDNGGLKVKVPEWENKAPFAGMEETVELQIDPGSGTFSTVASHVFTMPTDGGTYPETFPFDMLIPTNALPDDATCHLRYKLFDFAGDEFDSLITTVICDRLPPYKHDAPKAPVFAGDYLDDVLLPGGGKLSMTIPGYGDWQATDVIAVYLVDEDNIPEDPTTTPPIYVGPAPAPGVTDSKVDIDADKIRAFGDAKALVTYALRDKAFNDSPPALYKKVSLTFGPLPTNLFAPRVPQANPGPLNMQHVAHGVSTWIFRFDNAKGGDRIRLQWGAQVLGDHDLGSVPPSDIEIHVLPNKLMLEDYGRTTTGVKSTRVSYHVVRQGRLFGPVGDDFDVNFEVAVPWPDPWPPVDWPNPIHPGLLEGEVKNFDASRTNELTRADKDKDATYHFDWYADAKNGHIIDFYWNGERVVEAQVKFDDADPEHVPGGPYQVDIPWSYIKKGGNGNPVPVHYRVSAPGLVNDLYSPTTNVVVNAIAVELPRASFPTIPLADGLPRCSALEPDGSLKADIPDLTGLLVSGDKISVIVTPMRGNLGSAEDPIIGAEFEADFTLGTTGFPVTGFTFLVQPYDKHILPLYDENPSRVGRLKIQYFFNDGTEDIESEPWIVRTAFGTPTGSCPITGP
ncbi:hypothetical protein [Pseudomonas sp. BF-R-24]|uniref:hypothetical protein n=1 Tax=Pseudomonas sp. BF-R-24 TaxID=2832386 RepID=UPI001CBC6FF7|nr:hypothetical protein [Pseudomonas sp. BF-R-24]